MDSLDDSVGYIRSVLRANSLEHVYDGCIRALLELYACEPGRENLVLLELGQILGKEIRQAENPNRANYDEKIEVEIQEKINVDTDDIEIVYENVTKTINEEKEPGLLITNIPSNATKTLHSYTSNALLTNDDEVPSTSHSPNVPEITVHYVSHELSSSNLKISKHTRTNKPNFIPSERGKAISTKNLQPHMIRNETKSLTKVNLPTMRPVVVEPNANGIPVPLSNRRRKEKVLRCSMQTNRINYSDVRDNDKFKILSELSSLKEKSTRRKSRKEDSLCLKASDLHLKTAGTDTNAAVSFPANISSVTSEQHILSILAGPSSQKTECNSLQQEKVVANCPKSSADVSVVCSNNKTRHCSKKPRLEQKGPCQQNSETRSGKEEIAFQYYESICSFLPNINHFLAAYKAAEFAQAGNPTLFDDFLQQYSQQSAFVKVEDNWTIPTFKKSRIAVEHQQLFLCITDRLIENQVDFICQTFPDIDPDYLETCVHSCQADPGRVNQLVAKLLTSDNYPSRAEYEKRKQYQELADKFFTVEEFLRMYDDPCKYFYDETRSTTESYRHDAVARLKADFRYTSTFAIEKAFTGHNFHYAPAHYELKQMTNQEHSIYSRTTKRSLRECKVPTHQDVDFLQELAFVRLEPDIKSYIREQQNKRQKAVEYARLEGRLFQCSICCESEFILEDLIFCDAGHSFCSSCVRRQSEELIGQLKNHIRCLNPECSEEYPLATLKGLLKSQIYSNLERRRQAEEIAAAGIEGLESCPFCLYCEILRDSDRLFQCQNPECRKLSCRQCRELNHLPLTCEEVAVRNRLRNYVETKMTEALVRQCPTCKRKFVKSEGCNKMVCVCGTITCYVCRQQIKDYTHFASNPEEILLLKKCPLVSDTTKLHDEEVARGEANARVELVEQNPNMRVNFILKHK